MFQSNGLTGACASMDRHHLIISGTGRSGTTFLVQLLTRIGLETGFSDLTTHIHANCDAGMERDLRDPSCPYVVKNPMLCDTLDATLEDPTIHIDHALIPIRDLFAAAESRRDVSRRSDAHFGPVAPGGLWHTSDPASQEAVLAGQLYKLLHGLTRHEIPFTLLDFPRIVHDPAYVYAKIGSLLGERTYTDFLDAFGAVSRPELVHDFNDRGQRDADAA